MEHLIDDNDFEALLGYYLDKYDRLVEKRKVMPAVACVVLLVGIVDTALRTVFSEEDERFEELEERVADLEAAIKNIEPETAPEMGHA